MVKHIKNYEFVHISLINKLTSSLFKIRQEPYPSFTSIISFNTNTVSISLISTDPYHSL